MDNKQQEIKFNVVDVVKAIDTSVKESNQLSEIIKSSKLDSSVVNSINDYFKNINFITSSVTKVFQSIMDTEKIKPVNPIKLLWNLELSVMNLNLIIKQIPKVLQGIDTDTMKELILNLSPSKTDIKITKENEKTTSVEQTSIDKMTPFELIKCVFDLINSLNDVKLVNPIKVYLSLKLLDITLKMTSNSFQKIFGTLALIGKQRKNIINKSKDAVDAFKTVFDNIKTIIDDIFYINKWSSLAVLAMIPVLLFTSMLSTFMKMILSLMVPKNSESYENSINVFNSIINIIKNVVIVALTLIPMAPIFIISSAALVVASLFVLALIGFINTVKTLTNSLSTKKIISINNKINRIDSIVETLLGITSNILLLALASIVAIPALILDSLYILALVGFIYVVNLLTDSLSAKKIISVNNKINKIDSIIETLLGITSNILLLALISIVAIPALILDSLYILALVGFVHIVSVLIDSLSAKKIISINNKINKIDSIIETLLGITSNILLLALTSIVAIPALILVSLYILALVGFVHIVSLLTNTLSIKKVISINNKINKIDSIIKKLIVITTSLILLAVASIIAIPALMIDLIFIALLTGFIFVTNILLKIIKIKAKDILSMILLLAFIGMLVVVALAVSKLSEIGSKIEWIGVLNIMGAILAFTIYAVGIGFAASLILPIMGVAAIGLIGVLIIVGLLTIISSLLFKIQEFNLDYEKIKTNITTIIDSIKMIISSIFGPDETKEEKSDKGWFGDLIDVVGGSFRKLKPLAESILAVPFLVSALISIGCIFLMANMLEKISQIEISEDINSKVANIINTAKNITSVINTPVTNNEERKSDKGWLSSVGEFLGGKFKNIGQIFSNMSASGVLLSLLPNIALLRTITETLSSINDIKLDGNISTKVTDIINTVRTISTTVSTDNDLVSIDENKVKQFGNFVDDSVKYFKHINKLDVSKVKSLGDMYEKMGQFMDKLQDAPISEIADALVNKISPALSDINESMSKNNQSTQTQTGAIKQTQIGAPQQTQTTTTPVDYTSLLENIEDLLTQIKKKLNTQPQMSF